ncbi:hypothetical protein [Luteimicrobium sp. DT211]|uniref:hypothetical protein n=1 Tax=Luteimicrobium sp. DT211 TaxID=3393412 RepID=UPI003CF85084
MAKRTAVDTEHLKDQAAQLAGQAQDAASAAKDAAIAAKDWTAPRVEAFLEWLKPRVEDAYRQSLQAAAPQVEKAAVKAGPVIDTAHDRLIDEFLPRIVARINTLATQAGEGAGRATEVGLTAGADALNKAPEKVAEVAKAAAESVGAETVGGAEAVRGAVDAATTKAAKLADSTDGGGKSHKKWWLFGLLAAGLAAYGAWRRSRPQVDPWAEPGPTPSHSFGALVDNTKQAAGDAAEAVGEAAGATVARGRDAREKVTDAAGDLGDKVSEATEDLTDKVSEAVDQAVSATRKAASKATPRARKPRETTDPKPSDAVESAADKAAETITGVDSEDKPS